MKNLKFYSLIALALIFSCEEYEIPVPPPPAAQTAENADLSSITFVGGSRLAGLEDGAFSQRSVSFSIPHMILTSGEFSNNVTEVIPFSNSLNGFNIYENINLNNDQGKYIASFTQPDTTSFKRFITVGESLNYSNANSSNLRNFSFPKAGLLDLTEANSSNPFINAFFPNITSALIDEIEANSPSFLVIDAGMQDIVNFALNGAEGNTEVNDPNTFQMGDLLTESAFKSKLEELTNTLLNQSNETKGILMNIPDILNFPMFIKLSFDLTPYIGNNNTFLREIRDKAEDYNELLAEFYAQNPTIPFSEQRPLLDFAADKRFNWGIIVIDNDLDEVVVNGNQIDKIRQAQRDEYILLRRENELRNGYGSFANDPVPANGFISNREAELIRTRIQAYNTVLAEIAANSNGRLAIANTSELFNELFTGFDRFLGNPAEGIVFDGVLLEPLISEFGIFSVDGINLNPIGNVLIANIIIDALNANFDGSIKRLNPNQVPGTNFQIGGQ